MTPEKIFFASLDGDPPIRLNGYVWRPEKSAERHPAIILMHGCSGLFTVEGPMNQREVAWAELFAKKGYVALVIDSFTARGVKEMCSPATFQAKVYDARPGDAYGAMAWLKAQPDIAPDKIAMMGWSQGGGAVLLTARAENETRPAVLEGGDFAAAVAMYPGSCHPEVFRSTWTTAIPMLVLIGGKDVWTPASPCQVVTSRAAALGSDVTFHVYPTAYHDFDWPGETLHQLPDDKTKAGVVPWIGEDAVAHADAIKRVPDFLETYIA